MTHFLAMFILKAAFTQWINVSLIDLLFVMHIQWGKTLKTLENQHRSSLNMPIFTQLLIFALWSFLRPFLFEASIGLRVLSLPVSVCLCLCLCLCVCVILCVNDLLVRTITQDPFELGSPNLYHRCKGPWLRSLFFGRGGDWPWPSRSNLTSHSKLTPFWACPHNNSSPVQARTTKFGPEVENTLVKIPIVLVIELTCQI